MSKMKQDNAKRKMRICERLKDVFTRQKKNIIHADLETSVMQINATNREGIEENFKERKNAESFNFRREPLMAKRSILFGK